MENNISNNTNINSTDNLNSLVGDLKSKDYRYSRLSMAMKVIYSILIPIYVIASIFALIEEFAIIEVVRVLLFVASATILLVIFSKYQKEYRSVNYAEPTLVMLKKGAYRYDPFRKESWWAIVAIALLGLEVAIRFDNLTMMIPFFVGVLAGLVGGVITYYSKYKPLRDRLLNMIKELEN